MNVAIFVLYINLHFIHCDSRMYGRAPLFLPLLIRETQSLHCSSTQLRVAVFHMYTYVHTCTGTRNARAYIIASSSEAVFNSRFRAEL